MERKKGRGEFATPHSWRGKKMRLADSLAPGGRSRLWLYTSLLDDPNLDIVFRASRAICERFHYKQVNRAVWRRAKRRLDKFTVDKVTGEPVCVDPLFRLRGGCRRGRPSRVEQIRCAEMGVAGDILRILDEETNKQGG